MTLEHFKETDKDRNENLVENIGTDAFLRLWVKEKHKEWIEIADIRPKEINLLNQDELFFNPFRNGLHIRPSGFVHHLRYAVYPLSQFGRTLRHSLQEMLHQRDNRIIIERL